MKAVIFGGSAGIGRALAEQLAKAHAELLLIASDERDLDAVRSDLLLKHAAAGVSTLAIDLAQAASEVVVDAVREKFGRFDAMFFVAGAGDDDDCGVLGSTAAERLLKINFVAPALLISGILAADGLFPRGSIVVLSSVATVRGRGRNVLYGAAKRGLEQYIDALRAGHFGDRYQLLVFRLGYVDTTMMQYRRPWLPKARPETVARKIIAKLGGRSGLHYLPAWWRMIAWCVRLLPTPIWRRVNF